MGAAGLLGRGAVLDLLRAQVGDALAGRGGLVLLVGDAGIGKTSVADAAARGAVENGAELLWATCWDGGGAPAYWPWVQLLRDHAERHGPLPAEVQRLLAPAGHRTTRSSMPPAGDERERFRLFDAVTSLLLHRAREQPLVLVVDDLHWADLPSLMLMRFLVLQFARTPVLVVGTYRDDEVRSDPPRRAVLNELRRRGESITLTGLDDADIARLMAAVSGTEPAPAMVAEVSRRTAGNPFFVREVSQLWMSRREQGGMSGSDRAIPDGVRQTIQHRLARLPQACIDVLSMAAVAGRAVGVDVLARATGSPDSTIVDMLTVAVNADLLGDPPTPAGPYRFVHDLIRETMYEAIPVRIRAELHRQLAQALEGDGGHPGAGQPGELAWHYLLAAVGLHSVDLGARAVHYGLLAASDAVRQLAYEDAVAHCSRVMQGLQLAGTVRDADRLELLLSRSDALRRAGDPTAARDDFEQATVLARTLDDTAALCRAALGVHALGVESGADREACIALLEEALDRFGDEDDALRAQVLAALARELYLSQVTQRGRAARLSSAAVEIARRVGDAATLAGCLLAAHDTVWQPGTAARRRSIAQEIARVARKAGDRAAEAEGRLLQASASLELGDPAALSELDDFLRLGAAVGQRRFDYLVATRRAMRAVLVGRFAEAEALIDEAGELAAATAEPDSWNVQTRLVWSSAARREDAPRSRTGCVNPRCRSCASGIPPWRV